MAKLSLCMAYNIGFYSMPITFIISYLYIPFCHLHDSHWW